MSKVSFTDIETTPATPEVSTAVAVVAPQQVVIAAPIADASKGLIGEWTSEDTKLPRLSLVNKSGERADNFTPGTWLLEGTHQITKLEDKAKGVPLTVIALRMLKQYQENIPFDEQKAGVPVRRFNTAAEVTANGGRVSRERGTDLFSELAHIELLVQAPDNLDEDADALFYNVAGDKRFARVIYTASSTAYGQIAVTLASSLRGHLATTGLQGGLWELGSKLTANTKNSWWTPTIKTAGLVDSETAAMISSLA
jgi:hypothetical protein